MVMKEPEAGFQADDEGIRIPLQYRRRRQNQHSLPDLGNADEKGKT
jgi:hypothetical protein